MSLHPFIAQAEINEHVRRAEPRRLASELRQARRRRNPIARWSLWGRSVPQAPVIPAPTVPQLRRT